jgi:hypothetical protein
MSKSYVKARMNIFKDLDKLILFKPSFIYLQRLELPETA